MTVEKFVEYAGLFGIAYDDWKLDEADSVEGYRILVCDNCTTGVQELGYWETDKVILKKLVEYYTEEAEKLNRVEDLKIAIIEYDDWFYARYFRDVKTLVLEDSNV